MEHRRPDRRPALRVVALAVLLCVGGAGADEPAPTPTTTLPPAPTAIAPHEIPARAEQALREASDVEARLTAGPPVRTLQDAVADLADRIRQVSLDQRPNTLPYLTPRDLEDLEREWLRIQDALTDQSTVVARRVQTIEDGLKRLGELAGVWRATADAARAADLPDPVLRTIADVQKAIDDANRQLVADRDALLEVASQIAPLQQRVTDRAAVVHGLGARARGELFAIQAPPLWTALAGLAGESVGGTFRATWVRDLRLLTTYLGAGRLVARVLLFLTVLVLALDLRRRIATWPPDDADARARAERLAARPVASALLVAVVTGTLLFATDPVVVSELSILLSLAPLALLVRDRLDGRLRTLVPMLAVVFALATFRRQLPALSAWARLILSMESLGGLVWLGWTFGIPGRAAAAAYGKRPEHEGYLAGALLATAFVANLIGAVSLAVLLMQVVASTFLALALWAVSDVIEGLIVAGLRPWRRYPLRAVTTHVAQIRLWAVRLVRVVAAIVWAIGTLILFGVHRDAADVLGRVLGASLTVGSLHLSVQGVLVFAVSVWLAVMAAGAVRALLEEDVLARMPLPRGVPSAISAAANYTVLFVGILFAMSAAGLDLERVTLLAGAIGVGVGFGLQNVVNNFVSGLILLVERPMRVGDVVEIGPTVGTVRRIGIRSSTVRTFDGAEVIVPNGTLIAERLTNWTFSDYQRRIEVSVQVPDDVDAEAVRRILEQAAQHDVLPSPAPEALLVAVGQGKLTFVLRAWSPTYEQASEVQSRLTLAVTAALRAANVDIR